VAGRKICWTVRTLTLCAIIVSTLCGLNGCENTEPVSRIASCEGLLIDAARRSEGPVDQPCELPKSVWVVALPAKEVSIESLKSAGIPEDAALMLSKRESIRQEWCTVDELAAQPRPSDSRVGSFRRFGTTCINATLTIPTAVVLRSNKIVISATRSDQATVKLLRLSAFQ